METREDEKELWNSTSCKLLKSVLFLVTNKTHIINYEIPLIFNSRQYSQQCCFITSSFMCTNILAIFIYKYTNTVAIFIYKYTNTVAILIYKYTNTVAILINKYTNTVAIQHLSKISGSLELLCMTATQADIVV